MNAEKNGNFVFKMIHLLLLVFGGFFIFIELCLGLGKWITKRKEKEDTDSTEDQETHDKLVSLIDDAKQTDLWGTMTLASLLKSVKDGDLRTSLIKMAGVISKDYDDVSYEETLKMVLINNYVREEAIATIERLLRVDEEDEEEGEDLPNVYDWETPFAEIMDAIFGDHYGRGEEE